MLITEKTAAEITTNYPVRTRPLSSIIDSPTRIDSHVHSLGSRRFTPRIFIPTFNLPPAFPRLNYHHTQGFMAREQSSAKRAPYPPDITILRYHPSIMIETGASMRRESTHRSIGRIPLAWSMLPLPRLPILSRCYLARGGTPLGLSYLLLPPPLTGPDTFSLGRKDRPASRGIRVRPRGLTYI